MEIVRKISITQDNRLYIRNNEMEKTIDFARDYQGYFPVCRFTAAGLSEYQFYAAGTDEEGTPHLFCSDMGGAWGSVNLESRLSVTRAEQYGDILKIIWNPGIRQLFLVSAKGFLITVPDCPKCVRARKISDCGLSDAWVEDRDIYLKENSGNCIRYSIELAAQYRCSWSYAQPHVGTDGILLDLRELESGEKPRISGAVVVSYDRLEEILRIFPRDKYLFFVCEHGSLADEAAKEARMKGVMKAYSLGGAYMVLDG